MRSEKCINLVLSRILLKAIFGEAHDERNMNDFYRKTLNHRFYSRSLTFRETGEVQFSAFLGNHDRPTDKPTIRRTGRLIGK